MSDDDDIGDDDRPEFDWIKVLGTATIILIVLFIWVGVFTRPKPSYSFADQIRETISGKLGYEKKVDLQWYTKNRPPRQKYGALGASRW